MANEKTSDEKKEQNDLLWRKPIELDSFDDEDPLETLYRGREVDNTPVGQQKPEKSAPGSKPKKKPVKKRSIAKTEPKKTVKTKPAKKQTIANKKSKLTTKVTEEELKTLLKIKSDTFTFTDLREILRGKSIDIYAYLRFLSSDSGVCKIKSLDLMQILDISRPTLFKQGDWLIKLSLIEKHTVPGDHLGTSYTVNRLEDVLPVSEVLLEQMNSHIEKHKQADDSPFI